jgi:hypothetical protein
MKHLALIASLVVLSSVSFAQNTYKYELVGSYIFQFNGVQTGTWSATSSCTNQEGSVITASGGGSITYMTSNYGTATFDGEGAVTATEVNTSIFDQSLSNATVSITWSGDCTPSIYNGYARFDPPVRQTSSGTYTLNSENGTGSVNIRGTTDFQATGTYAACIVGGVTYVILDTLLLEGYSSVTPNLVSNPGIAQHSNQTVSACPSS